MKLSKNRKTLLICILCGTICAICVFLYTQSVRLDAEDARNSAMARYGGEQIEVCVAKRDIAAGETIDTTSYEVKLWLTDLFPDDAVRNSNDILGKQATSSIISGEVISSKRFQDAAVSLEVPAGLSAVSVPAKDVSAVGGAILAGMHIDVYATGNTSTTLIAQNVLVLATSTTFSQTISSSSVAWITLAVEPSSVQELVAASQTATLYFVLPSEDSSSNSNSTSTFTHPEGIDGSSGTSNDLRSKDE